LRAWVTKRGPWVVILTDLKNKAVCPEWDKQDFNFQKQKFVALIYCVKHALLSFSMKLY
jgi:hypothetical protein